MARGTSAWIAVFGLLAGCNGGEGSAVDGDARVEESAPPHEGEARDAMQSDSPEADHSDPTRSDGGGTSGSEGEGSYGPCVETVTELALDGAFEDLGFSARDLLETVGGPHEVGVKWHALDAGPEWPAGEETLTVSAEANADRALSHRCDDPSYPEAHRPRPRLEVAVILRLQTSDGRLDEAIETVLAAERVDVATLASHSIELSPDAVAGTLGQLVGDYYESAREDLLRLELVLREGGSAGVVMGPFSPHRSAPCLYTEYATWPADSACWYDQPVTRPSGGTLDATLEKLNRRLALSFADGRAAEAELEVALQGETACGVGSHLSAKVDVRLRSEPGAIDLHATGWLTTSLHTDTGVEQVELDASAALDELGLSEAMGYQGEAGAAIANLWVAVNPNIIPPVELQGGLRVSPIEREGFATELPEVALPGGYSEHCFDASGARRTPLLQADIGPPAD